jgi:hypothetical protein
MLEGGASAEIAFTWSHRPTIDYLKTLFEQFKLTGKR